MACGSGRRPRHARPWARRRCASPTSWGPTGDDRGDRRGRRRVAAHLLQLPLVEGGRDRRHRPPSRPGCPPPCCPGPSTSRRSTPCARSCGPQPIGWRPAATTGRSGTGSSSATTRWRCGGRRGSPRWSAGSPKRSPGARASTPTSTPTRCWWSPPPSGPYGWPPPCGRSGHARARSATWSTRPSTRWRTVSRCCNPWAPPPRRAPTAARTADLGAWEKSRLSSPVRRPLSPTGSVPSTPGRQRYVMHLEFTDEQLELRESARATLAKECPPGLVRDVAVGDEGAPAFHSQLTWLGWPALTIDVDLGGLGRGFVELAVLLEELGRAAAPGPFLVTMTQFVPAVREAGTTAQVHRFLAAVAAGQLNGTLALHEGGRWDPFSIGATASRDGDGWVLSGHKHQVLCCAEVDEVVVAARRESGALGLFAVPAAELTFSRVTSLDGTRSLGNLELNGVWVPEARMLGDASASTDATPALSAMLAEATVGMALDVLGICDALCQSSLDVALDGVGGGREPGSDATPPGGIEAIAAPVDTALNRNGRRAHPLSPALRG